MLDGVGIYLPLCLDLGEHQRAVELCERWRLPKPGDPMRIDKPEKLAYLLCKHKVQPTLSDEEVKQATDAFFRRYMSPMLGSGMHTRVALWMKALYWTPADPRPHPIDAFLRCYDFMDLPRPEFRP